MIKIKIKPLSVNQAWQGRRFKTKKYKDYESDLLFILPPKIQVSKIKKLRIELVVGYSNTASDIDNFLKPFLDILQKKYDFNDRQIWELKIKKEKTNKGEEFIKFKIDNL